MTSAMNCEPCALRETGHTDRAETIEAIRAQRLVLSLLGGDPDAVALIAAELKSCHDCVVRLASMCLLMYANSLIHMAGGNSNEAANWVQRGLLEDLDGQLNTPPNRN